MSNPLDRVASQAKAAKETMAQATGGTPEPVTKRVSLIIHNPTVPSKGNQKLSKALGWQDTDDLCRKYIADMKEASYGYVNYEIVERIEVDKFPVKQDGFAYTGDSFVKAWEEKKGFHDPDAVDYDKLLAEFKMVDKVNQDKVDEFWLFAFPYAGYWESTMCGPGAFWCNANPLTQTAHAKKRFIIMGFNYQRGVGQMLEAFGHRAESIMKYVFRNKKGDDNLWERFSRYEKTHPGKSEVGVMHFAPNSEKDYDWGNKKQVKSNCDDWYNFPNFKGVVKTVDCAEWGGGDTRAHHMWWYKHLPHINGFADGIAYNWWKYLLDPNTVV